MSLPVPDPDFYVSNVNWDAIRLAASETGPTGPSGTQFGPTGPTGVASTGPTGAVGALTVGPTGAAGVATTGPTGPSSGQTGPAGPYDVIPTFRVVNALVDFTGGYPVTDGLPFLDTTSGLGVEVGNGEQILWWRHSTPTEIIGVPGFTTEFLVGLSTAASGTSVLLPIRTFTLFNFGVAGGALPYAQSGAKYLVLDVLNDSVSSGVLAITMLIG